MQKTMHIPIPNIQGFSNKQDFFMESWSLHPLPWQPNLIFNFRLKHFGLAQLMSLIQNWIWAFSLKVLII